MKRKKKKKKKEKKRKNKQIKYYRVKYSKDVFANGKAYVSKWYRKLLEEQLKIYYLNLDILDKKDKFYLHLLKETEFRFNPQKREFK